MLTLPVQFYSGYGFYEGAYHAIKSRSGNMDLLISMGTLTAFIFSTYVTFFPGLISIISPALSSSVGVSTSFPSSKTCQQKYSSPEKEAIRLKRRLSLGWGLAIPIIIINYLVPGSLFLGQAYKDINYFPHETK